MVSERKMVKIDMEVYRYIQEQARGFESVNAVVRRLLGLRPAVLGKRGRKPLPVTGRVVK